MQSLGCADRPGLEGGPSAIHQWGPKSDHFEHVLFLCTADRPGLGAGPSTVLTIEGCSLHSPCIFVWTVRPGSADRPQVPIWFGQGLCVFGHLYYGLSGGQVLSHPDFRVQNPGANIITRCAGTKSHTYDESWHRIECHIFTT